MMKPRILVASASGKTGFATAMQLLEKKYPVCAFVHGQSQRAKILLEDGGDIHREHSDIRDVREALVSCQRAYF